MQSAYRQSEASLLSLPTGEIAILIPTVRSVTAPEELGMTSDGSPSFRIGAHRAAGMFLLPGRMQSCSAEKANRRMWDIGMRAATYGLALYVGQGDTLVRVEAPDIAQRFPARPVLSMFDANGGLADPLSRLRVAMLLRSHMPIETVADDLSPEDAFDPLLSTKSRALLKGRALDASMIEDLFVQQLDRMNRLLNGPDTARAGAVVFDTPGISRASGLSRTLHDSSSCLKLFSKTTQRWAMAVSNVQGTAFQAEYDRAAEVTFVQLITSDDPERIAANCAAELWFSRPADASGRRVVDRYCEGGDACKGVYDERKKSWDDACPRQPRWKP
jgi:hypothetical protein